MADAPEAVAAEAAAAAPQEDDDGPHASDEDSFDDEPPEDDCSGEDDDPVTRILKQLKSAGALIKKATPAPIFKCVKCNLHFDTTDEWNDHHLDHVSQPNLILTRLEDESDDEEGDWPPSEDEDSGSGPAPAPPGDVLRKILNTGIKITPTKVNTEASIAALKVSGLLSVKKITPMLQDFQDDKSESSSPKMESTGTLKMTIKHSTENKGFEVINGSNKEIKTEDQPKDGDEWRPEDTKEGILNKMLETRIKTESNADDFPNHTFNPPPSTVKVKSEFGSGPQSPQEPKPEKKIEIPKDISVPQPMLIPKKENDPAIIELNCDSDKDDDDDIVFIGSSTNPKAPDTPVTKTTTSFPKVTNIAELKSSFSTPEKSQNYNWHAPSKGDALEALLADKNPDALFESLLSNHRKDHDTDLGTSEYISLDKLGPQHNCDFCNTRFTSIELLEVHRKQTGHSNQLVSSSSSMNKTMTLSPYQQPSFLMNSLLPVQQLADTVSKIASNSSTSGPFTHQQNIMVNIQSFPNQSSMGAQPPGGPHPPSFNYSHPYQQPRFNVPNHNAPYNQFAPGQFPNQFPYAQPPGSNFNPYPPHTMPHQPYAQNQFLNSGNQILGQPMGPPTQIIGQPGQIHPGQIMPPISMASQGAASAKGPNVMPMPGSDHIDQNNAYDTGNKNLQNGIKIQGIAAPNGGQIRPPGPRLAPRGPTLNIRGAVRGGIRGPSIRPGMRPTIKMSGQAIRGIRPAVRGQLKRPHPGNGNQLSPAKKRMDMLLPDKHDNDECEVMSLQQHRDGLPMIQSIKGSNATPPVSLSSEITWKKTVKRAPSPPPVKDSSAMANILASRGIKITPKKPLELPNLGSGISVSATKSTSSNFSIPEEEHRCPVCDKNFLNNRALTTHMSQNHPSQKLHSCESCSSQYPTYSQLAEHKRLFHNTGTQEMGLPVVDLSQHQTVRKLSSIGITHFIPLTNRDKGGGYFGVPIVSASSALNSYSLSAIGSDGVLTLGPIKTLPN